MEKLFEDFSLGYFILMALVFVVLLIVLRAFAWKPILQALEDREEGISNALASAENAKKEMEELQASNEALLQEARQERDKMLKEAVETKNSIIADSKEKAQTEASKIIEDAKETIENQKKAAIVELKSQVGQLSLEIAEKILEQNLQTSQEQEAYINKLVENAKTIS